MSFDLIAEQTKVREMTLPVDLYTKWSALCGQYDHGEITKYEWEEMKSLIYPLLAEKTQLERQINNTFKEAANNGT